MREFIHVYSGTSSVAAHSSEQQVEPMDEDEPTENATESEIMVYIFQFICEFNI